MLNETENLLNNIIAQLQKQEKSIRGAYGKIIERVNNKIWWPIFSILLISSGFLFYKGVVINNAAYLVACMLLLIVAPMALMLAIHPFQKKKDIDFLQVIRSHTELFSSLYRVNNINEILDILEKIHHHIFTEMKFLTESGFHFKTLTRMEIDFCSSLLQELKKELLLQIEKQKENIIKGENELLQNLSTNPELNQVSELQQARLNRQIEQFEQLQKILVKA